MRAPSTVLTLEITGGSLLHEESSPMGNGPILYNDFISLMAGGLYYVSGSFWIRGGTGLATYTIDSGENNNKHLGITGVGGASGAVVAGAVVMGARGAGMSAAAGTDTLVTIGANSIRLTGITAASIDATDFRLA